MNSATLYVGLETGKAPHIASKSSLCQGKKSSESLSTPNPYGHSFPSDELPLPMSGSLCPYRV